MLTSFPSRKLESCLKRSKPCDGCHSDVESVLKRTKFSGVQHDGDNSSDEEADDDFFGPSETLTKSFGLKNKSSELNFDNCYLPAIPLSPPHSANVTSADPSRLGPYESEQSNDEENSVELQDSYRKSKLTRRRNSNKENFNLSSRNRVTSLLDPIQHCHRRKRSSVPESDRIARARCFDYLVSAIDEVWAQYCSSTTTAEDQMYEISSTSRSISGDEYKRFNVLGDSGSNGNNFDGLPWSPVSLDGNEDDSNNESDSQRYRRLPSSSGGMNLKSPSSSVMCSSNLPDSIKLLNLKKRLMNAKYFFLELLDQSDLESSAAFWQRWDLVKYAAIELVEEDGDDDEIVESVTDELEQGRHYSMACL